MASTNQDHYTQIHQKNKQHTLALQNRIKALQAHNEQLSERLELLIDQQQAFIERLKM